MEPSQENPQVHQPSQVLHSSLFPKPRDSPLLVFRTIVLFGIIFLLPSPLLCPSPFPVLLPSPFPSLLPPSLQLHRSSLGHIFHSTAQQPRKTILMREYVQWCELQPGRFVFGFLLRGNRDVVLLQGNNFSPNKETG